MLSGLISLFVVIVIIGLIVWAINTLVPMDAKFKQVITVVGVVVVVILVLNFFFPGALAGLGIR